MRSVRFYDDFKFPDKTPSPGLLLLGTKADVSRVADAIFKPGEPPKKKDDKKKDDKKKELKPPSKKAKGFCYYHVPDGTFYFKCKGAMKLARLAMLLKRVGIADKVQLGEPTEEDEARASASELATADLEASIPEVLEEDDNEDEAEFEDETGDDVESEETPEPMKVAEAPKAPPMPKPTDPTKVAPKPALHTTPEGIAYQERVDALKPAWRTGLEQGGEFKVSLTLAYSQAEAAGRKKDYVAANKFLDDLEKLLSKGTTEPTPTTNGEPEAGKDEIEAFKTRLNTLKGRYDKVKDLPAGAAAKAAFVEAVKAVATGKATLATEALDTLEARITSAERTSNVASEIAEGGDDVFAYRTALVKWQRCRSGVRNLVDDLIKTVLADPETQMLEKEDWERVEAAMPTLRDDVAGFDDQLDNAVNGYLNMRGRS